MNGPQKFPRASALSHALGSVLPRCGLNAVSSSASILATILATLEGNAHARSLRSNGSIGKKRLSVENRFFYTKKELVERTVSQIEQAAAAGAGAAVPGEGGVLAVEVRRAIGVMRADPDVLSEEINSPLQSGLALNAPAKSSLKFVPGSHRP